MTDGGGIPGPLTTLSERLYTECGSDIRLSEILAVLQQCVEDLDVAPAGALPELLERLARARLQLRAPDSTPPATHAEPGAQ